jgi:hypothetical protein
MIASSERLVVTDRLAGAAALSETGAGGVGASRVMLSELVERAVITVPPYVGMDVARDGDVRSLGRSAPNVAADDGRMRALNPAGICGT